MHTASRLLKAHSVLPIPLSGELTIFIMRSDRMQIALVLAGLLFACISAALIIAMAIPSTETVLEGVFNSAQGVAGGLQTRLEQEMGSFRVHKMLRGQIHRRLDEALSVVRFSAGPSSL